MPTNQNASLPVYGLIVLIAIALLFLASVVASWTGPTASPPSGNVPAPVNVGSTDQVKDASLGVNGLAVFGNAIVQASSYLNWGTTAGSAGYGFRDNGGTMQARNSGGAWSNIVTSNSSTGDVFISGNVGLNVQTVHCVNGGGCDQDPSPHYITASCPSGYLLTGCMSGAYDTDSVRLVGGSFNNSTCWAGCQSGGSDHEAEGSPCNGGLDITLQCLRITDIGDN